MKKTRVSLPELPEGFEVRLTPEFRYEVWYHGSLLVIAYSPQNLYDIIKDVWRFNRILEEDSFFEVFPDYLYYYFIEKTSPKILNRYVCQPYIEMAKTKSGVTFYCFRFNSKLLLFTKDRIPEVVDYIVTTSYDPDEVLCEYIRAVENCDVPEDFKNAFLAVVSLIKLSGDK
ncbi:MAG: hypothetical protein J7K13_07125 [Thermoplasmata archaeon]|nr:hypothetical protein [Thermoplasmata archaeon]